MRRERELQVGVALAVPVHGERRAVVPLDRLLDLLALGEHRRRAFPRVDAALRGERV